MEETEAIRAFVRLRPLNDREIAGNHSIIWKVNDETSVVEDSLSAPAAPQRIYSYDHCLGADANNQATYNIVGKPVVLNAFSGCNGTVMTYGETGSGKSWSLYGGDADPGMIALCGHDLFELATAQSHEYKYIFRVNYFEIYNEEINDLLNDPTVPSSKNLKIISDDAVTGVVISGLTENMAKSADDFVSIMRRGLVNRSMLDSSVHSSRSHTIYRITIEVRNTSSAEHSKPLRSSLLHFVKLAGSERQRPSANSRALKEGANISKSLLALGAVICKLCESNRRADRSKGGPPPFIPYRDSKLTRILKQSLGGNTFTSVLCVLSPSHRDESISTLKFGQICRTVRNSVKATVATTTTNTITASTSPSSPVVSLPVSLPVPLPPSSFTYYENRIAALTDTVSAQERRITELEGLLHSAQERETEMRREIDEQRLKIEEERLLLQMERVQWLKERNSSK